MRRPGHLALPVALAAACGALLWAAPTLHAYPQWQFTTGAVRCNQCHFAPAGGGLITGYGRDFNGEDLATFEGDGAFAHGAVDLPGHLKLGADLRLAALAHDNGGADSPQRALFPMQADVHARVIFGEFALQAIGGARGQVRHLDSELPPGTVRPANPHRLISREHWLSWQPAAQGVYVRAGRFFAPFGLRLAEHVANIRRDLGFNTLQETYNLSGGYLADGWEAHATVLGPDFLQSGSRETGFAAFGEYRLLDRTAAIGAQSKFTGEPGSKRWVAGLVWKMYFEPASLLALAEANYALQMPSAASASVGQFVGLFGLSWLPPLKGLLITAWVEKTQTDVTLADTGLGAFTGLLSWFPYAHFEVQLVGRFVAADDGDIWPTFLAQLHYFL
ncbi:MAG: hypothetical protein QN159_10935 [Armatimonadota bacterium]|nr:hypothetical protein [Armatimonadota bacterium]